MIHQDRYRWTALTLASVGSGIAALVLAVVMNNASLERERTAREASGRNSERALCTLVVAYDNVYRETPPGTETGKRLAITMRVMRVTHQCDRR